MASDYLKITKKDNFNALYELVSNAGLDQETEDRLHTFIDHEMELLAARAEKSRQYQQAHGATNDAMTSMICDVLAESESALTVPDIVAKIVDSTPQKIVYRLGRLFKDGKITKESKNIKLDDGPARKVIFYSIAK